MWEKILKANDITQVHISDEVESGYLKDISVAAYGENSILVITN